MTARRAIVAAAIAGVVALVAAGLSAGGGATRSFMLDVRLDKTSLVTDDVAPKGRSPELRRRQDRSAVRPVLWHGPPPSRDPAAARP